MTAYNQINGTPAAVSPLLQSLVVGEWGYDGFITTDATLPGILVTNQHYYDTLSASVAGLILGGTSTLVQQGLAPTIQMAEDDGPVQRHRSRQRAAPGAARALPPGRSRSAFVRALQADRQHGDALEQ